MKICNGKSNLRLLNTSPVPIKSHISFFSENYLNLLWLYLVGGWEGSPGMVMVGDSKQVMSGKFRLV